MPSSVWYGPMRLPERRKLPLAPRPDCRLPEMQAQHQRGLPVIDRYCPACDRLHRSAEIRG